MSSIEFLRRSLVHYWRTNLAVVAGVAIAVAVLSGALTVGVSVRASLRDLALQRLGNTDLAAVSTGFFREQLAGDLSAVPLIAAEGFVTDQSDRRRAARVQVYAVDDRFWKFHGLASTGPEANDAFISEPLARELGSAPGDSVLLRLENGAAIPVESLFGRKDDVGRTIRLTVRKVLRSSELGEFSLSPRQGAVRAIFAPLKRMQAALIQPAMANAMLARSTPGTEGIRGLGRLLNERATLDDLGLQLRSLDSERGLALESRGTLLPDALAATASDTAARLGMRARPVLTYLANTMRAGEKEIPYSVISGFDWHPSLAAAGNPIVLNEWAARELTADVGDKVAIEFYLWETEGRLSTQTADFTVSAIVPLQGVSADSDLVPEYPGITDTDRLADWDPPFPIDLRRVRPVDEAYWKQYRATPKAFIPFETARRLWRTRHGSQTSLRIQPAAGMSVSAASEQYAVALRSSLDPGTRGFTVYDVRTQSLTAASGSTDFGEYFTYFSMFLVVSALLLAAMFFKLGIEQRVREIGLMQAVGVHPAAIRRLFLTEGVVLSVAGGIAGMAAAVGYGAAIMFGLRNWWIGAVGTNALTLHVDVPSLVTGAAAGVAASALSIWWSLRSIVKLSPRLLLGGELFVVSPQKKKRVGGLRASAIVFFVAGLILLGSAATGNADRTGAFFGAGSSLLIASLCWAAAALRIRPRAPLRGNGSWQMWRFGFRNTHFRPARSVLCIALIASATFVVVAIEAFKRSDREAVHDRRSGEGGYPLLAETMLPVVYDLNDPAGRDALNLPAGGELNGVRFDRFRVKPGDDASCLNLYRPSNPRMMGATADFIDAGRFSFAQSLASTEAERKNPWLLLNRAPEDGVIPVITDANSMTYVLHLSLGDIFTLPGTSGGPVRLRLVGALADSIFQGELLMAESQFVRVFPEWEGYRFFLVDVPPDRAQLAGELLESRLSDFGLDAVSTTERLAGFHRVEYTYLSTFQTLGGLGLVLGTLGLGAVLLRNVLERRRELALLRALGYGKADFLTMVVAENVFLLVCGLGVGTMSALLAISPTLADRGGRLAVPSVAMLLLVVLAVGLLASIAATVAALRTPLLPALRTE